MTQKLEINPSHPVIVGLAKAREARPEVAKLVARQVRIRQAPSPYSSIHRHSLEEA